MNVIENTDTKYWQFKLLCKSEESDDFVRKVFECLPVESEEDIHEIHDIICQFRPKLYYDIYNMYKSLMTYEECMKNRE